MENIIPMNEKIPSHVVRFNNKFNIRNSFLLIIN